MKWREYIIKAVIMVIITIIIIATKDITNQENAKDVLTILVDAFTVPGIIFVCFGTLIFCANGGTFDMLAYGCRTVLALFKSNPRDEKYRNFREYKEAKAEHPKKFASYLICGGAFVLIGLILFVIYRLI